MKHILKYLKFWTSLYHNFYQIACFSFRSRSHGWKSFFWTPRVSWPHLWVNVVLSCLKLQQSTDEMEDKGNQGSHQSYQITILKRMMGLVTFTKTVKRTRQIINARRHSVPLLSPHATVEQQLRYSLVTSCSQSWLADFLIIAI